MRHRIGAFALVLAGLHAACLHSQLVPCGDNWCVDGLTCVIDRCATPAQIAACSDVAEGGTCSFEGAVGKCGGGICLVEACGNSVVDRDEECDDGNTVGGDGCAADCSKFEMCRDGVVDEREGCDDGNTNPADGCDDCVPTTWRATPLIGGTTNLTSIGLANPAAVAVDRHGNIYIADTYSHRILRLDTTGVMTTVAGMGTLGVSGDGGFATNAQLNGPAGVAVDDLGIYISDTGNHRIRRVDVFGVITTVAGTGEAGPDGDYGPAILAGLDSPERIAVDGLGNLYIADAGNHRIRRVDPTGIIMTVAGDGTPGAIDNGGSAVNTQLSGPAGVAVDGLGNLYIADTSNHRIRKVDANGMITTLAGGGFGSPGMPNGDDGPATSARLLLPHGIALDGVGNVYIADSSIHRIRRIDPAGTITTVAGSTEGFVDEVAATSAKLAFPLDVATDSDGTLYIADTANLRIRRVDPSTITTVVGNGTFGTSGDGGAATCAELGARHIAPGSVAVDGAGNLYFVDPAHDRVRRVDAISGVITTAAGTGVYGYSGDGDLAITATLAGAQGVAADGLGRIYIADTGNHRIRRIAGGIITTIAGGALSGSSGDGGVATSARLSLPSGIAVDSAGNLFIADTGNHRIRRIDAVTTIITTVAGSTRGFSGDTLAATAAQLNTPLDVEVDGTGNVYIADTSNHRIRRVAAATGIITSVAGAVTAGYNGDGGQATTAQLFTPSGVAVDGVGNLYIADTDNHRIRRVAPTGVIATVAGNGAALGSARDGIAATAGVVISPPTIAVDSAGALYLTDSANRVRRIDTTGMITTVAGRINPPGMGPLAQAHLADARALVVAGPFTLVAGGSTGTVQAARFGVARLDAVVGRYPQGSATDNLARFRDEVFGNVSGLAYDSAAGLVYLTEANQVHVVTIVDPDDAASWTIAPLANAANLAGFADGAALDAGFRAPTGLYLDPAARKLYVADTGNHVVRVIDLASAMVSTIAGIPQTRGFGGDGEVATAGRLHAPEALTRCPNGDLFVADTGNHRVRRIATGTNLISTVLGTGLAGSADSHPASGAAVNAPRGLACDALGNLFVTSTMTVRLLPADVTTLVDGTGEIQTIYGAPPREFPASVTSCLTGIAVVDATTVQIVDSCSGLLVELVRGPWITDRLRSDRAPRASRRP